MIYLFYISPFKHFALIFLEYVTSQVLFHDYNISFRKYKQKVVIYLYNDDLSKATFFMLNIANCQINWSSLFLAIEYLHFDICCFIKTYVLICTFL